MKRLFYDKGEESAVVDSSFGRSKMSRIEPSSNAMSEQPQENSLPKCTMTECGQNELKTSELKGKMEEEQERINDSFVCEEDAEINQAIDMAVGSSKLVGANTTVMKEALKMALHRRATVDKIANKFRFSIESPFYDLIKKSCEFRLEICGVNSKILPVDSTGRVEEEIIKKKSPLYPVDPQIIGTIRDTIINITAACKNLKGKKDLLPAALNDICTGELTVKEASDKFKLQAPTLLLFLQKIRIKLRNVSPQQIKPLETLSLIPPMRRFLHGIGQIIDEDEMMTIKEGESVTIDGITVPNTTSILTLWLSTGRLNYSRAQRFFGSKYDLREKMISILEHFKLKNDIGNLVDAIMHVHVYHRSIVEACRMFHVNEFHITTYFRIAKIFIDFSKSPCTSLEARIFPLNSRIMGVPQLLPRPPVKRKSNVLDTQKEKKEEYGLIKEEPIEPPHGNEPSNLAMNAERNMAPSDYGGRCYNTGNRYLTIDGIMVPNTITLLSEWLSSGRLNYSRAKPFFGTEEELRKKMISILLNFKIKTDLIVLVEEIMYVYVYHKTVHTAAQKNRIYYYVRILMVFINFAQSPCTQSCPPLAPFPFSNQNKEKVVYPSHDALANVRRIPMRSCIMDPPQLLPRPPVERNMNEWDIKKQNHRHFPGTLDTTLNVMPMSSGIMNPPQLLPRPPVEKIMNEMEMKKEIKEEYGLVKEEPIEPPLQ